MPGEKKLVWILPFVFVMWPLLLFAEEVYLPKTGQTTSYSTGDDGDIQAGVKWPSPRFVDNGNGTITDNLTGLIWLQNHSCGVIMYWADALTYCNNLASGSCGLTDDSVAGDWRLPNIVELESLMNLEEYNLAAWLNTQGFINVPTAYFWSSTTLAWSTNGARDVHMEYGYVCEK